MLSQKELNDIRNSFPKCPRCIAGRITKTQYAQGNTALPLYDFCDACESHFPPNTLRQPPRPTIPRSALNQPAGPPTAKKVLRLFSQGLRYFVFPLTLLLLILALALLYVVGLVKPHGFNPIDREKFIHQLREEKKPQGKSF